MKNGRENRNNGNQEEGEKEKETLRTFSTKSKGTLNASPKFFLGKNSAGQFDGFAMFSGTRFSCSGHRLR
jgi:hypothetical protein